MNKDGNKPFIKSSHNILMGFSPVSGMHILKTKICSWQLFIVDDVSLSILFIIYLHEGSLILGRVTATACGVNYCRPITVLTPLDRYTRPRTGDYMYFPYSLQTVCGFFNVPQNLYMYSVCAGVVRWGLWFIVPNIQEAQKVYAFCKCLYKGSTFCSVMKNPECQSCQSQNQRPPTQQSLTNEANFKGGLRDKCTHTGNKKKW